MKCPNCGAEIAEDANFCEYCGSQITLEMQREREQFNKSCCPMCGSTNITFYREKQGEIKGQNGMAVLRSTVGVCKDCGHTWSAQDDEPPKKRKTWLWVLGWLLIFPLPLTILLLRPTVKWDKRIKFALIALAWLLYGFYYYTSQTNNDITQTGNNETVIAEDVIADNDGKSYVYENAGTSEEQVGTQTDLMSLDLTIEECINLYNASFADIVEEYPNVELDSMELGSGFIGNGEQYRVIALKDISLSDYDGNLALFLFGDGLVCRMVLFVDELNSPSQLYVAKMLETYYSDCYSCIGKEPNEGEPINSGLDVLGEDAVFVQWIVDDSCKVDFNYSVNEEMLSFSIFNVDYLDVCQEMFSE